jgi:hypothetical protein
MTDANNSIKPIRYRLNSYNSQQPPPKRRKTRAPRNASSKPAAPAPTLGRATTPASSASSSHNSPLHECSLYFPQRNDEDEAAMASARTLGASIAQSANEGTHVCLQMANPSKKQQQQIFGWKEQGKLVVSLTWIAACVSTWSRQPEFNHPPGRGDQSLVTGQQQGIKISINPFNHDPPPLDVARDDHHSDESSLRNLEELATRYAKSTPPPSQIQKPAPVSASRQEQIQQKIRNAMAPTSNDPNVKIWTEERITPEALMAKRSASRRKSLRLGTGKK